MSKLTADAGLLVTSERTEIAASVVVVYPHGAGAHLPCNAFGPAGIAGKNAAAQAVYGIIGDCRCFFVTVEFNERNDRAENLLLSYAHLVVHVGKNRGRVIAALFEVLDLYAAAAAQHLGA